MNPNPDGHELPKPAQRGPGDTMDLGKGRPDTRHDMIPPTIDPDRPAIPPTIDPASGRYPAPGSGGYGVPRAIPPTIDPDSGAHPIPPTIEDELVRVHSNIPPTIADRPPPAPISNTAFDARTLKSAAARDELSDDERMLAAQIRARATAPTPSGRDDGSRTPTLLKAAVGIALGTFATLGLLSVWIVHSRTSDRVDAARAEAKAARAEAAAKREALEAERQEAASAASKTANAAWDRLQAETLANQKMERAFEAVQAAQAWCELAPDDPLAARAKFRAAMALGELATASEQWGLARHAFEQAQATEVNGQRSRSQLAQVEKARQAEQQTRSAKVLRILVRVSTGEPRQEGSLQDAVLEISRYSDPNTVEQLADGLDTLTQRLAAVRRKLLLDAMRPTTEERRLGMGVLAGLDQALDALARRKPGERLSLEVQDLVNAAELRVHRRALRAAAGAKAPPYETLLAWHQLDGLGQNDLDVAWVICNALGHMGRRTRAVRALSSYLEEESDPRRAAAAGTALCRIGGRDALTTVRSALERHTNSAFTKPVLEALRIAEDAARREGRR